MLSSVVAIGSNYVIGNKGTLPWHLPNDLKKFKEITTGHTMIMGRKTFESLPNILPNRHHIILTRDKNFTVEDERVTIFHSVEELLATLDKHAEYFVIGGAEIFKCLDEYIDRIYLTIIDEEFEGDVYFPRINFEEWEVVSKEKGLLDEKNKYPHTFYIMDKLK